MSIRLAVRRYGWLALALALGAVFRFVGLDAVAHPDERDMLGWAADVSWPELRPGRLRYPSAFTYQLAAIGNLVPGGFDNWGSVLTVARTWVALVSTAAIAAAWAIGRAVGGPAVGAYAAFGIAVLDIVVLRSHYALTDIPALALAAVSLWLALRASRTSDFPLLLASAAFAGLALSTKYSAASVAAAPVFVAFMQARRGSWPLRRIARRGAALAGAALAAFALGTPYALIEPARFWEDLRYVGEMQAAGRGGFHMATAADGWLPAGAVAYPQVVVAELGILVALLALVGSFAMYPRVNRWFSFGAVTAHREAAGACLACVVAAYAMVFTSNAIERHYILLAYPPLMALAGLGALGLSRAISGYRNLAAGVFVAVLALSLTPLAYRAAATDRVLARVDSRSQAADWYAGATDSGSLAIELHSGRAPAGSTRMTFLADRALTSYCREGTPRLAVNSLNEQRRTSARDRRWYARLREHGTLLQEFGGPRLAHLDRFPGGAAILHDPRIEIYELRCEELVASLGR